MIQFVIEHEHRLSQDAKINRNEERNHHDHSKLIFNEYSCDIILPGDQLEGQYLQRHQVIETVTNRKADSAHESPQEISPKFLFQSGPQVLHPGISCLIFRFNAGEVSVFGLSGYPKCSFRLFLVPIRVYRGPKGDFIG